MSEAIAIGSRLELFIDDFLLEKMDQASLKPNVPTPKEITLTMNQPWEGNSSAAYPTVIQDGEVYRLYYRSNAVITEAYGKDQAQCTCYAESKDGVEWFRPNLGLMDFHGSTNNNIILQGSMAHTFSPFLDLKPGIPPQERFKALAGNWPEGLVAFKSENGVNWTKMREAAVITDGAFDSQNLVFWDRETAQYRCYSRYFDRSFDISKFWDGIRAIQSCKSKDFVQWSRQTPHQYDDEVPLEHFYTNATIPCPGAEHMYLSFPMRFMPERYKVDGFPKSGISDSVLMSSRDGVHWSRPFMSSWIHPGTDQRNWTARSLMVAHGIVSTTPDEFSIYVVEHYEWEDAYLRRYALPRHRFGSIYADYAGGNVLTKPFTMEGERLVLNYSTSGAGSIQIQLEDDTGQPWNGFTFADFGSLYGDELDYEVEWKSGRSVAELSGIPIRLRIELKDADLYALQFASGGKTQ
ncbi:hypothetical protein [Paenibacillus eucommiae]|uniref:Uncharacterized protein n=1 Tax=Paenibacillus eucommiae TaxID=1355755 RepID=A0ABS4IU04_9BACL|nr:hypothetical protein [Paenibacillus eucommiae]MBP1991059.1 hypothetical protein [Paenibacillus eucommiae]